MYAIIKTGGKQYRVEQGQYLLVERLPVDDGAKVSLAPLLYVDGSTMVDGDELASVKVEAKVLAHERGPKLWIVKFKPKRGYRRRNGHRQELTRLEVTEIKLATRPKAAAKPKAESAPDAAAKPSAPATAAKPKAESAPEAAAKPSAEGVPATEAKEAKDGA